MRSPSLQLLLQAAAAVAAAAAAAAASGESAPKRVRIFDGGFESNEEYTYVRGRGRGRYVCEECGIRCKKPSMLKKHIRTHTDVRPFTCKHCNFSFKTKGNLTKHMKSKAHYKKCVELGISPVPTVVDDSYIDEESLARQQALRAASAAGRSGSGNEDDESDDNEDDDDDEDDEDDDEDDDQLHIVEDAEGESRLEREAARGLLSLSAQAHVSAGLAAPSARPRTYPYHHSPPPAAAASSAVVSVAAASAHPPHLLSPHAPHAPPLTPTLGAVSAHTEREKLSRNSGLAAEPIRQRGGAAVLLPPQAGDHRYYFPSARSTPAAALEPAPAGAGGAAALAPVIPPGAVVSSDLSSGGSSDDSRSPAPTPGPPPDRADAAAADAGAPMDLSSHRRASRFDQASDAPPPRRFRILDGGYDVSTEPPPGVFARTPTTPASEILTPVAEPATLLASLCSSAERVPATPTDEAAPAPIGGDPAQATMLQAYLTERALQDTRRKQLQQSPAGGAGASAGAVAASTPTTPAPLPSPAPAPVPAPAPPAEMPGPPEPASSTAPELALLAAEAERAEAFRAGGGYPRAPPPAASPLQQLQAPPAPPPPPAPAQMPAPAPAPPAPRPKAEFMPPSCGPSPSYVSVTEDGRSVCVVCNKVFSKPSQLRLHVNIHYFERPFRCDSCAVSFRTKGHLQKHERSVSHQNKVSMNSTFGTPTTTNPRPFKCDDCKIAFRIHGHLAKHLRSKMHIMKLECVGKLPFGTYAEMEREGVSLNEIDTTDCENSLESLQMLAQRLYEKDPNKLERWEGEPVPPISGGDTSSDEGEPLAAGQLQQQAMQGLQGLSALTPIAPVPVKPPLFSIENQLRPKDPGAELRDGPPRLDSVSEADVVRDATDGLEMLSRVPFGCPLCPRVFAESGALQIHALMDHGAAEGARRSVPPPPPVWEHHPPLPPATGNGLPDHGTLLRIEQALGHSKGLACDVCRMPQPSLEALQKHLLGHAQPRPYVCDCCDAGFSSQQQLLSHREMHRRSPGRPQ
ncbi:hypothetical protein R5R35_011143 [Gryllus longicercus]|uniref:C2H2-type domain-containing protein n=1 Tax=Gryllus longicercus TaxID=2509291 RepID=A0AAN9VT72_9ORTH